MVSRVYLDWNATAPLRAESREALLSALREAGNPSSVHAQGRDARALLERARNQVAALLGAEARGVIFTSGATEANMLALTPTLHTADDPRPVTRLLASAVEHPSVQAGGRFATDAVDTVPVTPDGAVDLDALETAVSRLAAAGERVLVSIMAVNNETGVIQPVVEAARIVHEAGGLLHVDAVQAAGRIEFNINEIDVDLVTVSSHKIGGPQGAGALVRAHDRLQFAPAIRGGGQERGWRAGTENVAAIAGFGAAAAEAARGRVAEAARLGELRERLERGLLEIEPDTVVFGQRAGRAANTTLFAVPGIRAETALIALDLEGIAVSSGAACSSGKVTPSHVLAAMGVPLEIAAGAIRVSTGWSTSETDIETFLKTWRKYVAALGKAGRKAA